MTEKEVFYEPPRLRVGTELAERLIQSQFPYWAELELRPIVPGGWDNWTFRLGEEMTIRLPSAERYAAQVSKEQLWLPRLSAHLPLPIPVPLAIGKPEFDYPWQWSIYQWMEGEPLADSTVADRSMLTMRKPEPPWITWIALSTPPQLWLSGIEPALPVGTNIRCGSTETSAQAISSLKVRS